MVHERIESGCEWVAVVGAAWRGGVYGKVECSGTIWDGKGWWVSCHFLRPGADFPPSVWLCLVLQD